MLKLGNNDRGLVVRNMCFVSYSSTTIPQLLVNNSVQAVFILGKYRELSNNLHTGAVAIFDSLCLTSSFITSFYTTFTTTFTLLFGSTFNLLGLLLMPTIHTTNKNNEILYKLITIN